MQTEFGFGKNVQQDNKLLFMGEREKKLPPLAPAMSFLISKSCVLHIQSGILVRQSLCTLYKYHSQLHGNSFRTVLLHEHIALID